jgi:hypothetical protein
VLKLLPLLGLKMAEITFNLRHNGMENYTQSANSSVDVQNVLREVLLVVGRKILNDSENISFADLNTAAGILQKLVACYVELKPFAETFRASKIVSQEVLDTIQTQLNLL